MQTLSVDQDKDAVKWADAPLGLTLCTALSEKLLSVASLCVACDVASSMNGP